MTGDLIMNGFLCKIKNWMLLIHSATFGGHLMCVLKDHISSDSSEKTRYQQHTNFITIQSTTLVRACCKE